MTGVCRRERVRTWLRARTASEDDWIRWLVVVEMPVLAAFLLFSADPDSRPESWLRWLTWVAIAFAFVASLTTKWLPTIRTVTAAFGVALLAFFGADAGRNPETSGTWFFGAVFMGLATMYADRRLRVIRRAEDQRRWVAEREQLERIEVTLAWLVDEVAAAAARLPRRRWWR
jgi:hypothetical protein